MRELVAIRTEDVLPDAAAVLESLDVPAGAMNGGRSDRLVREAIGILAAEAAPKGVFEEISREEFEAIYRGEGRNASETPLDRIHPRATDLGLFAGTAGEAVSARIAGLFDSRDFALAASLDAAASHAAERTGEILRDLFVDRLCARARSAPRPAALAYSPGYCGWDVSGQRALFAALRPQEIGIFLNESCLMQPLKSVSGVIVAGSPEIHVFDDSYPFCAACATHGCRDRIRHATAGAKV